MKPAITDHAYATITPETVARAADLELTSCENPGQYYVTGGSDGHYVDLYDPNLDRCDCEDYLWRDRICKHVVAVLVHINDHRLGNRLRELMAQGG